LKPKIKIVLITTGQPTTNPRLVKEADALSSEGYDVTVIYQNISEWATQTDINLLATRPWKVICVAGNPKVNFLRFILKKSVYKLTVLASKQFGFKLGLAESALTFGVNSLSKAAKKIKANLYIAHNLGALPVAVKAAKYFNAKCGFDAEDFHRHEISDETHSFNFKIRKFIEEKFITQVDYLTASSPMIAMQYQQIFNKKTTVVLNAFQRVQYPSISNLQNPLRFVWFSQTIGNGRGIDIIIDVLNVFDKPFELHLLGNASRDFLELCKKKTKFTHGKLIFHQPIPPDDIFNFCREFDIGLCLEQNHPFNRSICLTNKIFTYFQSGLAIIASDTPAQSSFLNDYGKIGSIFNDENSLLKIIKNYDDDRKLLNMHKLNSFLLGQNYINWEIEKQKFLLVVEQTLKT